MAVNERCSQITGQHLAHVSYELLSKGKIKAQFLANPLNIGKVGVGTGDSESRVARNKLNDQEGHHHQSQERDDKARSAPDSEGQPRRHCP